MGSLQRVGRKCAWLRAALYEDEGSEGGGEGGGEGGEGEGENEGANGEGGEGVGGGAEGGAARRLRSTEDFTMALLRSQLHASTYALRPHSLRSVVAPPPLPGVATPAPDLPSTSFVAPWAGHAAKARRRPLFNSRRRAPPALPLECPRPSHDSTALCADRRA